MVRVNEGFTKEAMGAGCCVSIKPWEIELKCPEAERQGSYHMNHKVVLIGAVKSLQKRCLW